MTTATQTTKHITTRSEAVYCAAGRAVMHAIFKHRIDRAGTGGVLHDDRIPVNYRPSVVFEKRRLKIKFERNVMAEAAGFWALSLFLREQDKLCKSEPILETFVRVAQGKGNYYLGDASRADSYEQAGEFKSVAQGVCLMYSTEAIAILVRQAQVILKDPAVNKAIRAVAELNSTKEGRRAAKSGTCVPLNRVFNKFRNSFPDFE